MSVQAMAWAMKQTLATAPTARHVLLCLANYAGEDGVGAFPSVGRLARDTGLSERAVQFNLARLEESGAIQRGNPALAAARIDRRDQRPNVWNLCIERGEPAAPRQENGVNDVPPVAMNGVNLTTERGEPAAPEPSINHKSKSLKATPPAAPAALPEPPDWIDPDAWDGFVAMRQRIRAPLTQRAAELIFRELQKFAPDDPNEVLDQSTRNGWRGVFAIKPQGATHANASPSRRVGLADRHPRPSTDDDYIAGSAIRVHA